MAYANASKAANTKRQQATDAKNLAGEPGVKELQQAEANLPAAIKALTDATNAKPPLDKALADAKAATLPLQQAYDAAEKAAKEAEAAAKAASDAANKLDDEAKKATADAAASAERLTLPRPPWPEHGKASSKHGLRPPPPAEAGRSGDAEEGSRRGFGQRQEPGGRCHDCVPGSRAGCVGCGGQRQACFADAAREAERSRPPTTPRSSARRPTRPRPP